jgi:hypothetical protein
MGEGQSMVQVHDFTFCAGFIDIDQRNLRSETV